MQQSQANGDRRKSGGCSATSVARASRGERETPEATPGLVQSGDGGASSSHCEWRVLDARRPLRRWSTQRGDVLGASQNSERAASAKRSAAGGAAATHSRVGIGQPRGHALAVSRGALGGFGRWVPCTGALVGFGRSENTRQGVGRFGEHRSFGGVGKRISQQVLRHRLFAQPELFGAKVSALQRARPARLGGGRSQRG